MIWSPPHSLGWRDKLAQVQRHLRFAPFEQDTEEGRAAERHRRILLTALAAGASKAMGALTGFISIPLTLKYLDKERYGLWMTISTFVTMLSFADLGVGNGLRIGLPSATPRMTALALSGGSPVRSSFYP